MRIAAIILLLLVGLNLRAQSLFTNVFSFVNAMGVTQNVKQVSIEPLQALGVYGDSIIVPDVQKLTVKTNTLPVPLLSGYSYRVKYYASVSPELITSTFTNYFSTNVSGVVSASDYVTISTNLGSGIYAYSQAQSDARYPTFAAVTNIAQSVGGSSQTNYPYTAITNAPWLTNNSSPSFNQVTTTNGITATGNGSLISGSSFSPGGILSTTTNIADGFIGGMFYGNGSGLTALPPVNIATNTPNGRALNSLIGSVTNSSITFAGSATGSVSVVNNVLTGTIGASNAVSGGR